MRTSVDLLSKVVAEEVDNVLTILNDRGYEYYSQPESRQKLIGYVIQKVKQSLLAESNSVNPKILQKLPYHSLELRLRLEKYVYEGLEYILLNNLSRNNREFVVI